MIPPRAHTASASPRASDAISPELVRYFVAVAEAGQLTAAARRLGVSQPAVSAAIADLEDRLGVRLLQRHPRGVTLTPAGEAFRDKAEAALTAEADADQAARSLGRGAQGAIMFGHAGLPPWMSEPRLIEEFSLVHPRTEIILRPLPFPTRPRSAWLADVDVAIACPVKTEPALWMELLRVEPRALMLSRDHPLADRDELEVAEVLDETFVGFDDRSDPEWVSFWSLGDHRGDRELRIADGQSLSGQARFSMIASGVGVSSAPACHAEIIQRAMPGVVAIPLRDAAPARIWLVGRRDRLNPSVEAMRAIARDVAAENGVQARTGRDAANYAPTPGKG